MRRRLWAVIAAAFLAVACNSEPREWEQATKANSTEAYERFLERYPEGTFAGEARNAKTGLVEGREWASVSPSPTIESLRVFLSQYPDGAHAEEARATLRKLKYEQAWQDAVANGSLEGWKAFLDLYADGEHRAEAQASYETAKAVRELSEVGQEIARHSAVLFRFVELAARQNCACDLLLSEKWPLRVKFGKLRGKGFVAPFNFEDQRYSFRGSIYVNYTTALRVGGDPNGPAIPMPDNPPAEITSGYVELGGAEFGSATPLRFVSGAFKGFTLGETPTFEKGTKVEKDGRSYAYDGEGWKPV